MRALTRKPEKTQQLFNNHPNLEVRTGWVHADVQGRTQPGVCGPTCRWPACSTQCNSCGASYSPAFDFDSRHSCIATAAVLFCPAFTCPGGHR